MDLGDFCCFQYRQWNRRTNWDKPAFNSLDETGLHAELSYFHCIFSVSEIGLHADLSYFAVSYSVSETGLHAELSYIGCIIQC